MKTINEFLSHLLSLDVSIWVKSEKLYYSAPVETLTPSLKTQLRERKSEIIEFLQKADLLTSSGFQTILPVSRETELPLSFAQQRAWFLEQRESRIAIANLSVRLKISGWLKAQVLEQSLREIVQRHEILRTNIKTVNGQPVQVIAPTAALTLPLVDLRPIPEAKQKIEVLRLAKEEACRLFNLAQDPLLRVTLLQLEATEYVMLLTMHHIASDGWSIGVLFRELNALYNAFSKGESSGLPELPIQYADFAVWQRRRLQAEALENELSYWKQQLNGAPTLLQLPTDRPRPPIQTFTGKTQTFFLSKTLTNSLQILSQQAEATLFMTLLAAFKTLLYRYTGQEDILVGSPIANRNRVELEGLIGFFINTLVLRTNLSGNPSFRELLKQVREVTVEAYSHQSLPFEKLVEQLQLVRDLSYSPLFQVMFVLQNAISVKDIELPGLNVYPSRVDTETSQFDLTLDLIEEESGLTGKLEYNTDLFDDATIIRAIAHFQMLLKGIVADPDQRISDLPLLTSAEHQQFWEWHQNHIDDANEICIHQLFEERVKLSPNAVAIVFEDQQLTYQELNQRSNQLAHYLKKLGVQPEILVGICVERSLEMIIGCLGILKVGGAYIPIDPAYPQDRRQLILSDVQASVLLTQEALVKGLPDLKSVVCLDADWPLIEQESNENPNSDATVENLAYIIYTSGSTGKPKGVMIQHQSLAHFTRAAITEYGINPGDRVLQFASISFDTAAEEIFPCLVQGATLVLRTDEMLSSIPKFLRHCQDWKLTVLDLPTAFWHQLAVELPALTLTLPECVRLVIIGGEKALPERLITWRRHVDRRVRLVNTYGPTEATVVTTAIDLSELGEVEISGRELPIGKALSQAKTYILDPNLQPVPVRIPGELYIGGAGLARGYANRPELTAQAFIPDPFSEIPGARLYRTGDRVCYRTNGTIEFLGRFDNQVKLRGFRIELGEIEATIRQYLAVKETVVVVCSNKGFQSLVAYIIPQSQQSITIAELRNFLESKLPKYMAPTTFVMLEALPLTPNGKINRKLLPEPDGDLPREHQYVAPRTVTEEIIANIFTSILGVQAVGIHDNFFEMGGNSLLMITLHSELSQQLNIDLSLLDLFRYPTISSLVECLNLVKGKPLSVPTIEVETEKISAGKAQQKKRLKKIKSI